MGRMNFECILSNIHLSDNTLASTDPLVKLKPFIGMCDRNFPHVYKSNKNISVDEASCKWKGWFNNKVYNHRKPSKFHIKLFQVGKADSGHVIAFEVYIGRVNSKPVDSMVNDTMKLVLGSVKERATTMSSQITTIQVQSYYLNVSTDKLLEWVLCEVIERTCQKL